MAFYSRPYIRSMVKRSNTACPVLKLPRKSKIPFLAATVMELRSEHLDFSSNNVFDNNTEIQVLP